MLLPLSMPLPSPLPFPLPFQLPLPLPLPLPLLERGWRHGGQPSTPGVGSCYRGTSDESLRLVSNLLLLVELCHGRMHIYAVNYNL